MIIFYFLIRIIQSIKIKNPIVKSEDIELLNKSIENYDNNNAQDVLDLIRTNNSLQKIIESYFYTINNENRFDHKYYIQLHEFQADDSSWIIKLYKLISLDKNFFKQNVLNVKCYFGVNFFILIMSTDLKFLNEFNDILIDIISNMISSKIQFNYNSLSFFSITDNNIRNIITDQLVENISKISHQELNRFSALKNKRPLFMIKWQRDSDVFKHMLKFNDNYEMIEELCLFRYVMHPIDTNVEIISDIFLSWYYIFSALTSDSRLEMHNCVSGEKFTKYIALIYNRINESEKMNKKMIVYFALLNKDIKNISKLFNWDYLYLMNNNDSLLYDILLKTNYEISDVDYNVFKFLFDEAVGEKKCYRTASIMNIIKYYNDNQDMKKKILKFLDKTEKEFIQIFVKSIFRKSNWLTADQFQVLKFLNLYDYKISIIFLNLIFNECKIHILSKNLSDQNQTINAFSWMIKLMFSNWGYLLATPNVDSNRLIITNNEIEMLQDDKYYEILTELNINESTSKKYNEVSIESIYKYMFSELLRKNMAPLIESITMIKKDVLTEKIEYLIFYINLFLLNCSKHDSLSKFFTMTDNEFLKSYLNSRKSLFSNLDDVIYEEMKKSDAKNQVFTLIHF
ncbi:hypothetical protein TCON_0769 [Astathelohania contejeani]|uniref:Uncharacterized protein n=1 Tax=Astathelohania contejeani TaxID=164912 RepID=A0ABQ7I0L9_9MICR|nr:hypothetical protein TCON_0769 [Thelohania contejeani]